jgi:hypothetical protein
MRCQLPIETMLNVVADGAKGEFLDVANVRALVAPFPESGAQITSPYR